MKGDDRAIDTLLPFPSPFSLSVSFHATKLHPSSPGAKAVHRRQGSSTEHGARWPDYHPIESAVHRVGEERGMERGGREDRAVTEQRTGQRWRKGSCVYDLSTSLEREKVGRHPPPSVRPTDKPSFFCNFRARSPGNPWKIRDPTETVLLSRRVTRVSGFVAFLSLLSNVSAARPPWTRTKLRPCNPPLWKIGRNFGRIYPTFRSFRIAMPYIAITFHALERQSRDRFFLFSFSNGFSLKVF